MAMDIPGGVIFVLGYKLFVFWLHEDKETSQSI